MKKDERIFISIISAYINENEIFVFNEEIDWQKVLELSTIHSVSGIIASAIAKYKIDVPIEYSKKLQSDLIKTTMYSVRQESIAQKLFLLLEENKISNVVYKGYTIKNLYPEKELRTMGDVDLFIENSEFKKANDTLIKNGFSTPKINGTEYAYTYSNFLFEIHTSYIDDDMGNGFDYGKYFDANYNSHIVSYNGGYNYTFDPSFHLLFMLAHMAAHFFNDGFGIRMLMDVHLLINKSDNLDWEYISKELKNIRLYDFACNILYICKSLFSTQLPNVYLKKKMNTCFEEKIITYILNGGTFGFNRDDINLKMFRQPELIDGNGNLQKNKLSHIINWIFPNYQKIQRYYPWFRNKPICFLPIGWIYRIFDKLLHERKSLFDKARTATGDTKKAEEYYQMIKSMGLYNKDVKDYEDNS